MKTEALQHSVKMIGYYWNGNEESVRTVIEPDFDAVGTIFEPFNKELRLNLLERDSREGKETIIRHYLCEFWQMNGFFKGFTEDLFEGNIQRDDEGYMNHRHVNGQLRRITNIEVYAVECSFIFNMLMDAIQWACSIYQIDFFKICSDLKFSLRYFDSSTAMDFSDEFMDSESIDGVANSFDGKEVENDLLNSTIEDWLEVFKSNFSESDYQILVSALVCYFRSGSFPKLNQPIKSFGKYNIKKLGWSLNQIYRAEKQGKLSVEYLVFIKNHISGFENVEFDETNILKSNLYKYLTTKV